jgi:hypothetical protein
MDGKIVGLMQAPGLTNGDRVDLMEVKVVENSGFVRVLGSILGQTCLKLCKVNETVSESID